MGGDTAFGKAICSICYEDLDPIAEDLQSISVCGHVFHELCLQQWFEYCSGTKKISCPVCKQTCVAKNVNRLYFQSVGDAGDSILSQKPSDCSGDLEAVRKERKRLDVKVSGLTSALEQHQKDLKALREELCLCKEAAKKEAALKSEALRQNASNHQMLLLRSEELEKSTSECLRVKERNMSLAKELAALKLVTDLNLEEGDVLKLASFGNEGNNRDTVDVLKRSLVIRNKSYTELIAKCNLLGRGEARTLKKLDKAKEKIKKLKMRVQELETAIEIEDNEVLRALKTSKSATHDGVFPNSVRGKSNSAFANKNPSEDQAENPAEPMVSLDQVGSPTGGLVGFRETEKFIPVKDTNANNTKDHSSATALNGNKDSFILLDEDVSDFSPVRTPRANGNIGDRKTNLSRPEAASGGQNETFLHTATNIVVPSSTETSKDSVHVTAAATKEDVVVLDDDISQSQPLFHIRKETPLSASISQSGDRSFAGGFLGPDGVPRYLGKWCKRVQRNRPITSTLSMQGSTASTGNLIATGADGRGGTIKVLRSLNESSVDPKESSVLAKRCKYGATKTSSSQSKGSLQIEHFFGKVGQ